MEGPHKKTIDRIMHDCEVCKKSTAHEHSGWGEGPLNIRFVSNEIILTRSYGPRYQCPYCKNEIITCDREVDEYHARPPKR